MNRGGGGVEVNEINGWLIVTGQTYPFKESLKRLGFRWKQTEKCWAHPAASQLVRAQLDQILGHAANKSATVAAPSHITFSSRHSQNDDHVPENDANYHDLVNVHFVDDDDYTSRPVKNPTRQRPLVQPPPAKSRARAHIRDIREQRGGPWTKRGGVEELYVDQRPAVHLEVFCPSDDDEVY
jgi:hypothetical protein